TKQQQWMPRAAAMVYASCFAYIPLFVWSGIRDARLIGLFFTCMAICAALSVAASRGVWHAEKLAFAVAVVSNLGFMITASCFGPLILLPGLAAANATSFAIYFSGRLRLVVVAMGCLAIVVPILLEITGALPAAY